MNAMDKGAGVFAQSIGTKETFYNICTCFQGYKSFFFIDEAAGK
jgi:hypothetical protein